MVFRLTSRKFLRGVLAMALAGAVMPAAAQLIIRSPAAGSAQAPTVAAPVLDSFSHASGARTLQAGWSGGRNAGNACEIRVGGTALQTGLDCNAATVSLAITPALSGSWSNQTVALHDSDDGTELLTLGSATCSPVAGTGSANDIDEDCDGSFDEIEDVTSFGPWTVMTTGGAWSGVPCVTPAPPYDDDRDGGTRMGYTGTDQEKFDAAIADCQAACQGLGHGNSCLVTNVWNRPDVTRGDYLYCSCAGAFEPADYSPTYTVSNTPGGPGSNWTYSFSKSNTTIVPTHF